MSNIQFDPARMIDLLSCALRDGSAAHNLPLDAEGWTDVPSVLQALKAHGFLLSRFDFENSLRTHAAGMFVLSPDRRRVRALPITFEQAARAPAPVAPNQVPQTTHPERAAELTVAL